MGDPSDNNGQGYAGQAGLTSPGSGHNARALQHRIQQDARRTVTIVKILAVHPDPNGGAPTADVQPMIDQVDGLGYPTPHGPVYGVLVGRTHSSAGTVVSDPQPGDLYTLHAADRDLTKLKNTGGQQSSPDSARRGSMADGILGTAVLTGAPKQALDWKDGKSFNLYDAFGARVQTSDNGNKVTVTNASGTTVVIKDGMTYLGGDPDNGGSFDFLMTASGPCSNAKGLTG